MLPQLFLSIIYIVKKSFALKSSNFTSVEFKVNRTEEEIELKNIGIFTVVVPGTIFNDKDVQECRLGFLSVFVDETEYQVLPGHNSFYVPDGKHKVGFKVSSKSSFLGKKGFWTYTDDLNTTFPYYPGYD